MPFPSKPSWQLPPGVSRATWDYIRSEHIASEYDATFIDSALMQLDMQCLGRWLPPVSATQQPTVADLGCGTGRVGRQLLPLGYRMVNVDLSEAMLRQVEATTPDAFRAASRCVRANLVEIDSVLEATSIDMAVCLFSSLGMIRGRHNRRRFLTAVRTILKPQGTFFVHVHNRSRCWLDPGGPKWLLGSRWNSWWRGDAEFGDRSFAYRRLPNMFLHIYSRRELIADLRSAGFRRIDVLPLASAGDRILPRPSWFIDWRAGGFFAVASPT